MEKENSPNPPATGTMTTGASTNTTGTTAIAANNSNNSKDTSKSTKGTEKSPAKKTPSKKTPKKTPKKSPKKATTPSSPKISYIQLVIDAIVALKDRTGSSQIAIQKYILSKHPEIPQDKLKQRLLLTLKSGVTNKRLVKVKASYKIHPDAKKKQKSKKKNSETKKLTKEQLAAQREKEKQQAKEKERQERIRKRKFPMEDLALIAEDKELKVHKTLPARPALSLVLPNFPSAGKSDTMGSGLLDDAFHVYHFFRGDVGWGRFPKNKAMVAPFTLQQWLNCVQQVLKGGARKARMLPPLMTHLFVVALQQLVPKELQTALTPASWSEVLMLYMDAMERYYTSEESQDLTALPGSGIDAEYLLGATDEHKDLSMLKPPTQRDANFYLQGNLERIQSKLYQSDPWMLHAEELLTLLKTLVDDILAKDDEIADVLEDRHQETYELFRAKRETDTNLRKLQSLYRKEQNEQKEQKESGVKVTRSNTKLPTVSEAQMESARRAQSRATDAYEKACREKRIRTEPIGQDRNFNSFYYAANDPEKVYIATRGKAIPSQASVQLRDIPTNHRITWHCLHQRSTLQKFVDSLDARGIREQGLMNALQPALKTVEDDIKAMNDQKAKLKDMKDLQRRLENAKLKCEVGRKSGRLAAQSEQEFFDLEAQIDSLEKVIAGKAEPDQPSLEVSTGLEMLRTFDKQGEQMRSRRSTRRDSQEAEEMEDQPTPFACSKLWSTGNIDGSGVVGSLVESLLEVEKRLNRLADWENGDRRGWIAGLETSVHSWHMASPPVLAEIGTPNGKGSPEASSETKKQRRSSDGSHSLSVSQLLNMLKQPTLQLEQRLFETSGLATAARDADVADDNMSASPEDDNSEEKLQRAWKKLVFRLNRLPAKAHSKIRHLVVDAIAAARKAQQAMVVAQLREALLQFHPEAAGACKSAALEILEQHGGYEEEDDDDEDENEELDDEPKEAIELAQPQVGLSSMLSFEAVILNSCLDGQEDASRKDWIGAVKKARTLSKLAALVAAFCSKASIKLEKLENEQSALFEAMENWEKASSLRKKNSKLDLIEPSEVWTSVSFTDEFCLAKVEEYPWWPAKKCIVKDPEISKSLQSLGRTMVSLIGESGGLRVVKKDCILPFSHELPEEDDAAPLSKDMKAQLDDCMAMARRIIRGKGSGMKIKGRSARGEEDFVEEKKLAT